MRFGFGLEKIGLACLNWPRLSGLILVIITAIAAFGVTQLKFDGDPSRIFRADNPVSRATDRQQKAFPSNSRELVLLFESEKPFNARQLAAMREVHLEIQFVDRVISVSSMFSARHKPDADGNAATIVPYDLPADSDVLPLLRTLYAQPYIGDLVLAKGLATAMIIARFDLKSTELDETDKALAQVAALTARLTKDTGLKVTLTGVMAVTNDVLHSINRDVYILNALGAAIAALVCFAFFRNWRYVLISALPPVISVVWILGSFGLTGRPMTAINNVLPTLVLVIAFCDALHMMQTIRRRLSSGDDVVTSIKRSIIDVGPACAMTSLTTMAACLSLMLSSSGAVNEFGAAGAASVFFAFIAVITLVPLTSLLLLNSKAVNQSPGADAFNRLLAKLSAASARLVLRHTNTIVVIAVLTLIATTLAYYFTGTDYDYRKFLSNQSPANQAIDVVDKKFGGADIFSVLVEVDKPTSTPPQALIAAHRLLEKRPDVRVVFSVLTAKDWLQGDGAQNFSAEDALEKLPKGFTRRLVSADRKTWLVTVYIPNKSAKNTRGRLDDIDRTLDPVRKAHPDTRLSISGSIARSAYSSQIVIAGLKTSLAAAVIITIMMVGVFVRSPRYAFISAVPNLLPLTLVAGGLFVTGNSFSLIAVMALTIAFGIAIDNTVHVVNRLQLETAHLKQGETDLAGAMTRALQKTGPVLFAATILLSAGIIVTRVSDLPSIREFGAYMTVVLVLALFSAIIVLPAIIMKTVKARPPK